MKQKEYETRQQDYAMKLKENEMKQMEYEMKQQDYVTKLMKQDEINKYFLQSKYINIQLMFNILNIKF